MTSKVKYILHNIIAQILSVILSTGITDAKLCGLRNIYADVSDVPLNELVGVITALTQRIPIAALIVDGLDECDENQPELNSLMQLLTQPASEGGLPIKILLTSRDAPFIQPFLSETPTLEIEPNDTRMDILLLTRHRLHAMQALKPCAVRIAEVVAEKAQGLFIWAEVFLAGLKGVYSFNDVEDYLANANAGLDSTYRDIVKRLENSQTDYSELRKKILSIVSTAVVPLQLNELEEALGVRSAIFSLDKADRMLGGWETIQKLCGPLLRLNYDKVELIHLSAREFILSSRSSSPCFSLPANAGEAHDCMANICLTYLCFRELQKPLAPEAKKDYNLEMHYPLLKYATLHWVEHFTQCDVLSRSALDLLRYFVNGSSGTAWASSYFPYFTFQSGESLPSALGTLQGLVSQLKSYISRHLLSNTDNLVMSQLLSSLDKFLIGSFERAVLFESRSKGTNARVTLERRLGLSKAYQQCDDHVRSKKIAHETFRIAEASFGFFDSLVLRCRHQILLVELELNMHENSKSFDLLNASFTELSSLMSKHLEPYHIDTLRCRHDVGLTLLCGKKVIEALQVLEPVLKDMQEHLGQTSALTQRTVNNVAQCYYHLRQLDQTDVILNALPPLRAVSGTKLLADITKCHPYTFDSLSLLAMTAHLRSNYERSAMLQERAIAGREHHFGPTDRVLYTYVRNLGLTLESQRRFEEAAEHYRTWQDKAERVRMRKSEREKLQRALDECLRRWQKAVERGLLAPAGIVEARKRYGYGNARGGFSITTIRNCWIGWRKPKTRLVVIITITFTILLILIYLILRIAFPFPFPFSFPQQLKRYLHYWNKFLQILY